MRRDPDELVSEAVACVGQRDFIRARDLFAQAHRARRLARRRENPSRNVSRLNMRQNNSLQPKRRHLGEVIWVELGNRGWRVGDLAERMEGDPLRNRALVSLYLQHPTGEIELGPAFAHKLGLAFGVSGDFFLDLEKARQ